MSDSRCLKFSTQQVKSADLVSVPEVKLRFVILQMNKETKWHFLSQFSFCNAFAPESFFTIFVLFVAFV